MILFTNTLSNVNLSNVGCRLKLPSNPHIERIATAKTVKITTGRKQGVGCGVSRKTQEIGVKLKT
jgi:hypothetical protein